MLRFSPGFAYSAPGSEDCLFAASDDGGGDRVVAIYSLISTAKFNGLNPETYLRHVPERIADPSINKMDELLPWSLLAPCRHFKSQPEGPRSMQNPSPQTPELKALLAHLQTKMSPKKRLQVQAAAVATEIIALAQRQSRLKKK